MPNPSAPFLTSPVSEPSAGECLLVRHISEVEPSNGRCKWLVEQLWLESGVGILGGPSKLGKTFFAAELAVAVASNTAAFGCFKPQSTGPVLFFGAEDRLCDLRARFDGLLSLRNMEAAKLPIYLIDTPVLRLDDERDVQRLQAAVERYRPRLLVLDPFVRVAAIDENSAAEVSAVLGSLRNLQRTYDLAVLVVHHARKSPAAHPAQALRGSSDFAAWSDTNLFLSRNGKNLSLFVEHRRAPSPEPLTMRLDTDPVPHIVVVDAIGIGTPKEQQEEQPGSIRSRILCHLTEAPRPVTTTQLRDLLARRKADVIGVLEELKTAGSIIRSAQGWSLAGRS
jgi:hypothetical protein